MANLEGTVLSCIPTISNGSPTFPLALVLYEANDLNHASASGDSRNFPFAIKAASDILSVAEKAAIITKLTLNSMPAPSIDLVLIMEDVADEVGKAIEPAYQRPPSLSLIT